MTATVNIGELKNRLSEFLERVENGDDIIVCKRNVPFATITGLPQRKNRSQPGWAASSLRILQPIDGPAMTGTSPGSRSEAGSMGASSAVADTAARVKEIIIHPIKRIRFL